MVKEETKEIFEDHMIAKSIKRDLEKIKTSPEMMAFKNGLKYKGEFSKQKDLDIVNLLLFKLDQYAQGWITCNAMKTGELYRKSQLFDKQVTLTENEIDKFIEFLNRIEKKYE